MLAVALAVVCAFSFFDSLRIGNYEFARGTFPEVIFATEQEPMELYDGQGFPISEEGERVVLAETDSTVSSVLIFGDSMTVLVANRLAAYGEKNGYAVTSVTWDGSSTVAWSSCDTLDNVIAHAKPDFIVVTLGSNELFLKNFDSRIPHVRKIVEKFHGTPFVWIGPPNWKEDQGFTAMMRRALPAGTFYDSNHLDLPRGPDHIHPTPSGGISWTDSIMAWIPFSAHPIRAERPDKGVRTRSHNSYYYKMGGGKAGSKSETSPETIPENEEEPTSDAGPSHESSALPPSEEPQGEVTPSQDPALSQ